MLAAVMENDGGGWGGGTVIQEKLWVEPVSFQMTMMSRLMAYT